MGSMAISQYGYLDRLAVQRLPTLGRFIITKSCHLARTRRVFGNSLLKRVVAEVTLIRYARLGTSGTKATRLVAPEAKSSHAQHGRNECKTSSWGAGPES